MSERALRVWLGVPRGPWPRPKVFRGKALARPTEVSEVGLPVMTDKTRSPNLHGAGSAMRTTVCRLRGVSDAGAGPGASTRRARLPDDHGYLTITAA